MFEPNVLLILFWSYPNSSEKFSEHNHGYLLLSLSAWQQHAGDSRHRSAGINAINRSSTVRNLRNRSRTRSWTRFSSRKLVFATFHFFCQIWLPIFECYWLLVTSILPLACSFTMVYPGICPEHTRVNGIVPASHLHRPSHPTCFCWMLCCFVRCRCFLKPAAKLEN